jgi:ethanolamine utilization protein EutN
MLVGRIVGTLTCSERAAGFGGQALMQVELVGRSGEPGETIVACNATTAGEGEYVVVAGGHAARLALDAPEAPVEAAIVAILDGGHDALRTTT